MRPDIPLDKITALPHVGTSTVRGEHLDLMGHMNVRWYLAFFDEAAWSLFADHLGMDEAYYRENNTGGFALQHVINYYAEVRVDETVHIHARMMGRTSKRIHFMLFMTNVTTGALAATLEGMGAHADMSVRRTSPYPPQIGVRIDALLTAHTALDWIAPVSGAIRL